MGADPPEMPPPDGCRLVLPAADGPMPPPHFAQSEVRTHPEDWGALEGKPPEWPRREAGSGSTTQSRSAPAPGGLQCKFSTRFVTGGFLEEDGEIWDESGSLVAMSRQLALVPR